MFVRRIALVPAALLLAAPSAQAQIFKKIKEQAKQAGIDAVGRKVTGDSAPTKPAAPTAAPAATARGSAPASPAVPERALAVNDEGIDVFLTSMKPVLEVARRRQARADAKRRDEAYRTCADRTLPEAAAKAGRLSASQEQEASRLESDATRLTEASGEVAASGNGPKSLLLADSALRQMQRAARVRYPLISQRCGALPPAPPAEGDADERLPAPQRLDGVTPASLGRLRERLAIVLLTPANATAEERQAIEKRRVELNEWAGIFRSGGMEWRTWSDLYSSWNAR